jgi:hypothetical protein
MVNVRGSRHAMEDSEGEWGELKNGHFLPRPLSLY